MKRSSIFGQRRNPNRGLLKWIGPSLALILGGWPVNAPAAEATTFGNDLDFLNRHLDVVVLTDRAGEAQVVVAPSLQGRVLTSTANGAQGLSFGWINRELIASKQTLPHMNPYGGEDRFWMGPEGGQFSVFFAKGAPFDLAHWFTPAPFDTEAFDLVNRDRGQVRLRHDFSLTNYSGARFKVVLDRQVRLLAPEAAWLSLGVAAEKETKLVAYESANRITNAGSEPWKKEFGLLSIWILGMFNPSPATTVVIPIRPGPETELGPPVNDDYFGQVPPERLVVKNNTVFFSGDGEFRSKIGINPRRCRPILGSYDADHRVLTLVQFTFNQGDIDYVNSAWALQEEPYRGDAANSYNDGPPAPGAKPLGPFYELESSSRAAALEPGQSLDHLHRTVHLIGPVEELNRVAMKSLGVSIDQIVEALP